MALYLHPLSVIAERVISKFIDILVDSEAIFLVFFRGD